MKKSYLWSSKGAVVLLFLLVVHFSVFAQKVQLKGTVSNESGELLPGVNITVVGSTEGTVTDFDGSYKIATSADASLRFSFVGHVDQIIAVKGQTTLNVVLKLDVESIDEVVVVGYGIQKKSSVTGAISSVGAKELEKSSVASLQAALQGKASGVSVVNNGSPGSAPTVRIRGNGSISYAADPLYIIDGVAASDITNFNSKDIESIEILKDASSTAIYGSRAANGVILITTKQGKKDGKIRIEANSYAGVQSVPKTLDLLSTEQYLKFGKTLNEAAGLATPTRFANMSDKIYEGSTQSYANTNTDWQNELFRSAMINDNNVSLSTGNDKSTYFASAGYFNQDGIVVGTGYKRGTFRFNSTHNLGSRFHFGQTLTYSDGTKQNEQSSQGRTLIMHSIRAVPYLPVEDPTKDGGFRGANSGSDGTDPDNAVKIQKLNTDETSVKKWFATGFLEVDLFEGLKFKSTVGYDQTSIVHGIHRPIYNDGFNSTSSAYLEKTSWMNQTRTITNQLTYDKTFGNHTLSVTAVQEDVAYSTNILKVTGNLPNNVIGELTGVSNVFGEGSMQENRLLSYLGRVNYEFMNRYLLSVSMRTDGSSKFAPGNKWGSFPSASFGWRVSEEGFMKSIPSISNLKLRAGYGELGNNGIGNYEWQSLVSNNTEYVLNGKAVGASFFNSLSNAKLQWETSKMTNVGIDLGMFDNKLTFTAEWFNKVTDNLILAVPYARSIGYNSPAFANVGKMKNYGMEFSASYQINAGELNSSLGANISFVRNEVLNLSNATATIDAGIGADFGAYDQTRTVVGQPIQSFFGWETDGIFQSQAEITAGAKQANAAPGDIRFKDLSGPTGTPDGVIDGYDRTFLGSYLPKFTYGINYSGNYKNFDFSVFFQGVYGNKIFNGTKVLTQGMLRLFGAGTEVMDAWTPTNTGSDIPRAVSGDPNQNTRMSDRFIEDGSYIRLKNISVGYKVSLEAATGGAVKDIRFYVSGQNLLTFTKYTGYDPEIGGIRPDSGVSGLLTNGVDAGLHPSSRSFIGGIQINF